MRMAGAISESLTSTHEVNRPYRFGGLSFTAVGNIAGYPDAAQLFQHTGGGFRDLTRIAGSSPEMWRDICIANRDPILAALDGYLSDLEAVRGMVEASDGPGLGMKFAVARNARAKWIKPQ